MENGSSQGRNQALTGLYVPSSLGGGVLPDCRRGWCCLIVHEGESEREGESVREGEERERAKERESVRKGEGESEREGDGESGREGESVREGDGESEREGEGESEREEGESERAGCCLIVDEVGDCHVRVANRLDLMCVLMLGVENPGWGLLS